MIPAPEFMDIKPGRERNNLMYFEPVLIFALCIKIVVNGFLSFMDECKYISYNVQ